MLTNDDYYTTIAELPFQPFGLAALGILFLMAATSHDFWLHNLTAPVWKTLHMGVYLACALIVLHVVFGVLPHGVRRGRQGSTCRGGGEGTREGERGGSDTG